MKKQPLVLSGYGLHGFIVVFKKFIAAPQQSNYSCNYNIIINVGVGFMSRGYCQFFAVKKSRIL